MIHGLHAVKVYACVCMYIDLCPGWSKNSEYDAHEFLLALLNRLVDINDR